MLNPDWHHEQRVKAEAHWNNVLDAVGVEKASALLLASSGDEVNIGVPFTVIEPTAKRPWEFHPDRQFMVDWISARRRREEDRQTASQERTLKMQWIALAISTIGAVTSVFNAIRSFWGS
jgi:hypothetical protein